MPGTGYSMSQTTGGEGQGLRPTPCQPLFWTHSRHIAACDSHTNTAALTPPSLAPGDAQPHSQLCSYCSVFSCMKHGSAENLYNDKVRKEVSPRLNLRMRGHANRAPRRAVCGRSIRGLIH